VRTTPAPIEFALPAPKRPIAIPRHLGCLVKMIFGFGVLLLMGYFALIALNPKAREWATKGAKDGSGGPTPFNTVNQILAIPAQAIGKTKDVVAAGDARVGVLDGVIAEEEGKKKKKGAAAHVVTDPFASSPAPAGPGASAARAAAAAGVSETGPAEQGVSRSALLAMHEKMGELPDPSDPAGGPAPIAPTPPPDPPAPAQVKLAGGIVIASASPADGPVVRTSFFFWIVKQNISGVFQSPPHRLMLNGQLVYEGDVINRTLGITFDHLDPANKVIVFRDNTGALVTRSY
jgi:hypothetical protein